MPLCRRRGGGGVLSRMSVAVLAIGPASSAAAPVPSRRAAGVAGPVRLVRRPVERVPAQSREATGSAGANDHGMVPGATVVHAAPAVYPPPPKASLPPPDGWVWRQLTVGAVGMQQEDEIAPVTISVAGAGPSATVMISDLAPGSAPEAQQPPTQQAQPPTEAQQPETLPRDAEWTVFHEPSLGTSLALPAAVLSVSDGHAHRGVGRRFKTPDGRAKVAIYAQHNMQHDTPASHLRKTFTFPRTSLDYERVTPDFFAVSGVSGGTIYYIRCNMAPAGEAFHCFELTYPAREKKAWDGIVTRMSRSLRAARSRSAESWRGAFGLARPSVAPWFLARATRP